MAAPDPAPPTDQPTPVDQPPSSPPADPPDPPTLDPPTPGAGPVAEAEGATGPGGGPVPPPLPPPTSPVPAPGSGGSRRPWVVAALAVGVLVVVGVAALAVGLVRGSGDDPGASPVAVATSPVIDEDPPGTDAELDTLWIACRDGDMAACDDLYVRSEIGSAYEDYGRSCGGRLDDAVLCAADLGDGAGDDLGEVDEAPSTLPSEGPEARAPGTNTAMDQLWAACAEEDWQACDDLFFESEFESVYEEFGRTCGYRIDDAFLCTEDMVDRRSTEDAGGGVAGAGPNAPATVAPATDAELDALWNACQDEDWAACDRLYFESEPNSDYEFFGATCGARDLLGGSGQLCQMIHAREGAAPVVLPTELAPGTCLDEPSDDEVVYWLQTVPCDDPHDIEIMGVAALPRGPFPDDISDAALDACLPIFDAYIGVGYATSQLDIYHLSPTPDSWVEGDRDVACGVYDPAGPAEGTLKGSGR